MSKRIVITETGVISSMGMGLSNLAEGLTRTPVLSSVKDYEFHQFNEEIPCYLVQGFDPVEVLGKKGLRNKDNATKILLGALEIGLKSVMETLDEKERPGLCIGTAFGSVQSIGDFLSDSIVNGVSNVNPQAFANTVINAPTGNANIRFVARNLSATISTGFNAGLDALIYAFEYMQRGYLSRIVAGGLEEVSYYSLLGLMRTGILSKQGPSQPFGQGSKGCVPGEGCALFLLETEDAARARGASILAEIAGVGSAFDPDAGTGKSNGEAGAYAINAACKEAGINPGDLGFIASGSNGTALTDQLEAAALKALGNTKPVTAYKAFTGECYGASGALSTMCALSDLVNNKISGPVDSYETSGTISLSFGQSSSNSKYACITSFSCEGQCSALILKRA